MIRRVVTCGILGACLGMAVVLAVVLGCVWAGMH
jgi:hypothetical protein